MCQPAISSTYRVGHGQGYDFNSIYAAIDAAVKGDKILVADGEYNASSGEVFPLQLKRGVELKREDENTLPLIMGDWSSSVIYVANIQDLNTVIDGFMISGGVGMVSMYGGGGGIYISGASIEVRNCVITNNHLSWGDGGGVQCRIDSPWNCSSVFSNCIINENSASDGGGVSARLNEGSRTSFLNCSISFNESSYGGGGIRGNGFCLFKNCTIYNNYSLNSAGIQWMWGDLNLVNCVISWNDAENSGGGIYQDWGNLNMRNCTVAFNSVLYNHGGLLCSGIETYANITNCIFWYNSPDDVYGTESATVTYCNIQGGHSGVGNIDAPPGFVDPFNADFRLDSNSPCIDSGTNVGAPSVDIDNRVRPNPSTGLVDIGAHEFYSIDTPTLTPTSTPSSTGGPTWTPTETPTTTPYCGDSWEPDDSIWQANLISADCQKYQHYFCHTSDKDWCSFEIDSSNPYRIFTTDLGPNADTVLCNSSSTFALCAQMSN